MRDLFFVRGLRNDPISRTWSRSRGQIGIFQHARWWFTNRLSKELVFIVWLDGERVGYTRFKPDTNGVGVIGLALLPDFRGRGYGPQAIEMTVEATSGLEGLQGWSATVHLRNRASIRAFETAGFLSEPGTAQSTDAFVALQLSRDQWLRRQVE